MTERRHPGVYVEERTGSLTPIQGVSTSNMGIVGFTTKGPTNVATLETSYTAFASEFGDFTSQSQIPTHTYAFFANGGRRAYVVRVVPSDAVSAAGEVLSPIAEEVLATGDGSNKDYTSGGSGPLTTAHLPIQETGTSPGSIAITYFEAGTPVATQACTPSPAPDGVAGAGVVTALISRIVTVGDVGIVPGSVTINALVSAGAETYVDTGGTGVLFDSGAIARGYIDYETGLFNLSFETAHIPDAAGAFTADYTPLGTEVTIFDDGAGALTSTTTTLDVGGPNTVDYATGSIEFKIDVGSAAPVLNKPILISYDQVLWDYKPISAGVWGNGLRFDVRGDDDFFVRATATFSRYDVLVYLDGDLKETHENLSFTDSSDNRYVGNIINNVGLGSKLLELTEPSNEDVGPQQLSGYARSIGIAVGNGGLPVAGPTVQYGSTDGTAGGGGVGSPVIPVGVRTLPLETPVQQASVSITYTDVGGETRTITDDGSGGLIGDVDPAAAANFNVIDYDTGHFTFQVVAGQELQEPETSHGAGPAVLVAGSVATAAFRKQPDVATVQGAAAGGTDGTSLTRSELTDPALLADREGMYALLTTNELMNMAVPDAAGNVSMSTDLITESERNGMWFSILATGPGLTPQQAQDYRVNTLGASSNYAALYYPYITVSDPVTDLPANIPPCGHIAGVYARTDNNKSVGKAPAGVEDGKLNFAIGLERTLEFAEIDILYPKQINALIDTPQTGRVVWGARTLENPPGDFRFIHVRRLFNFMKVSIFNSTHGFVFENVGASLRQRIKLSVESFMLTLYGQGLFKGNSPTEAFTVICDESNNPQEVEDSGTVICDIFVAANTPGEFIIFRISQQFSTNG